MRQLVQHLWRENRAQIVERSRLNCHAIGVHSLMLLESPGQTIRMFIADYEHELWKNTPDLLPEMSIGFHPHHCNLTLRVAWGQIRNWIVEPDARPEISPEMTLKRFKFQSALTGATARFTDDGVCGLRTFERRELQPRQAVYMAAQKIHTISVERSRTAAWFVFEGSKNLDYNPVCYSTRDLTNISFDKLYIRPTAANVEFLMRSVADRLV